MTDRGDESRKLDVLTSRVGILERLSEAPAYKRDLVDELDHSRSTINRAIGELEEVDLVERRDEGIAATAAGRLALKRLGAFRSELDDIVDAEAVIAPLPFDSAVDTDVVTGSEALLATDPAPYRPLERFHDALADAERYRSLLPALDDPRHVRLLYEHVVTAGRPAELVVDPDLFDALRSEFPQRMAAMAETDGFRVLVGDVPRFALGLVDVGPASGATVFVVVFNESGAVHGVLANRTASAIEWAEERYEAVRADAEERTDALLADADGGVRDAGGGPVRPVAGDELSVSLERDGFVRLGVSYFRGEPVADPTTAWRAGLTLPEVHTGYAVERTLESANDGTGERRRMTETIVDDLSAGTDCVVVGPPGSGKSTTCKRVACEWYDAGRGPVLYREQGRGRPFEAVEDLVMTVDAASGHTLVVVEDAVRPEVDAVFDAIERLSGRDDVSFLLDARESEWLASSADATDLAVLTMPPLAEADCRRLVEQFERTVDESVDVPVERLREDVRDEATAGDDAAPGEVLLLLHRLTTFDDPLAAGRTSLEEAVASVYDDLVDDDLALDVCVLANALNAAGIEVDAGALYAVAEPGTYGAVDGALDRLEGRVLFPRADGTYRTVHEAWSVAFLAHLIEAEGEAAAAERFGDCVTDLLSLADATDRCVRIANHREGGWTLTAAVDDPRAWADETVEAVYALGRERPKLAPLFGDGERDSVDLPGACSGAVADERPALLGRMFVAGGYYERAEGAFERLPRDGGDREIDRLLGLARVATERGEFDDAVALAENCLSLAGDADRPVARARAELEVGSARSNLGDYDEAETHLREALDGFEAVEDRRRTARVLDELGEVATAQGAYDEAREFHRRSLDLARELGDRQGEATSLKDLGSVMYARGEVERARERFQRSLDIVRELGDRRAEAHVFNQLAVVASNQGAHDEEKEYQQRSLEIFSEIGDRNGEARVLGNLGLMAERVGEYEQARNHLRRSLERHREVGDRQGVVTRLNNLGLVAIRQGEHDRAHDRFREGLDVAREIGVPRREANSLNGLGHVARMRGEYEQARAYHEQALAVTREVGFRRREVDSRNKLGLVARGRGRPDRAREHHEQALSIARELDHPREEAKARNGLADVARRRGNVDEAREHVRAALDRIESAGNRVETARIRLSAGRVALDRGDEELAGTRAREVREEFEAMGATQWAGRSRDLLGRVAAEAGSPETAREHWRAALERFETVGAPQDALPTLRSLVETCRERGDDEAAARWCRRARDVVAEAPGDVADRHREWIQRHLAELDAA